jgi:hypothetical protein
MLRLALLLGGFAGAAFLLAAQFLPLYTVHTSATRATIDTIETGSHDSYALVPAAVLALLLSIEVWRSRNRLALLAIGVIGLVALLVALLGDLPDAHATGLVGSAATNLRLASSSPSLGLYLETVGAVVLLITSAAGLLLEPPGSDARHERKLPRPPGRSEAPADP